MAELTARDEVGVGVDRLHERPVGRRPLPFVAPAPQHREPFPLGQAGGLVGQPGLADALLPGQHHQATPPGGGLAETLE